jgi:hypothetical protein
MEKFSLGERTDRVPLAANPERTERTAREYPERVATAIKADPEAEGVFSRILSGAGKGLKE